MSTACFSIACQRCGNQDAVGEYNSRSREEWQHCPRCGVTRTIDGNTGVTRQYGGYGTLKAHFERSGFTHSFSKRLPLAKRVAEFKRWCSRKPRKLQSAEITYRDRGRWHTLPLVSQSPQQKLKERTRRRQQWQDKAHQF